MSWLSRAFGRPAEKPADKPVTPEFDPNLSCSFCGKVRREVAKLIAGPQVYICDTCIALCVNILDEEDPSGYHVNLMLERLTHLPLRTPHAVVTPRLRALIELAAGNAHMLRRIVAAANQFEDRTTALAALAAIPADQQTNDDRMGVAVILLGSQRYDDAVAAFDRVDEAALEDVDRTRYRLYRALAELERGGVTRARLAVHRMTALDAEPVVAALPASGQTNVIRMFRFAVLALALLGLGELEDAERAARDSGAVLPDYAFAAELLSRILAARGDTAGADAARKQALDLAHPDGALANKLRAATTGPFR